MTALVVEDELDDGELTARRQCLVRFAQEDLLLGQIEAVKDVAQALATDNLQYRCDAAARATVERLRLIVAAPRESLALTSGRATERERP